VKTAARAAVLVFLLPAVAGATEDGVPIPHGWIGTTSEWMRGTVSCIDCHGPAHPEEKKAAGR
jgi:hypothetical protein